MPKSATVRTKDRNADRARRLVFVTGPSGAGRSTAVKALEDIGFEVIDNLPLSLLPRLLEGPPIDRPLALGIDVRNRDFSTSAMMAAIDRYWAEPEQGAELLYLDCSREVLIRRYSETRRRHPMAPAETPVQGIEREIEILTPIRARASVLIDTSDLTPHDLRAEIERWFGAQPRARLAVSVQSFSYKRGTPRGVDMMFDCRFLRNPYWDKVLRQLDGLNPDVSDFVQADPRFDSFFQSVSDLMQLLLPAYAEEGKSHITIAFGCTGGQHRSVAVAEKLANALAASGWQVSKRHRELGQRGDVGAVSKGRIEDRT